MYSKALPLAILSYALPTGGVIERVTQRDGTFQWAIRNDGACFNREGEWEAEPTPSNRDADFYARCRYATPEEAYGCWMSLGAAESCTLRGQP